MERDWKTCFRGKKILVAEDDELARELMNDVLSQMHCELDFAMDGNEVVEKVTKQWYDLVLMDIRMPNKDGVQATREIRALNSDHKRVPIVALTAASLEGEESLLQAGMNGVIFKPIILSHLRETMAEILLR
ncbi:MAG: response regulator [Chlamydiales bacterium]|nr:response regulator [Chlamydiales bacterium]